jgi:uncharacterized repeat protein (TIGR03803 family)
MKTWLLLSFAGLALGAGPAGAVVTAPTLHSFVNSGGCQPYGELIDGGDGYLYGTTSLGGSGVTNPAGTVYRITPAGAFTSLYTFEFQVTGDRPFAGLVRRASDGALFGTNRGTGSFNGNVFRLGSDGSGFTNLHTCTGYFVGADGGHPEAPLADGGDGSFYGTTSDGGATNVGTIYRIDANGDYDLLHSFRGSLDPFDGATPLGGLARGDDGTLYGTTSGGGPQGASGTVFRFTPGESGVETIHAFTTAEGAGANSTLVKAADGWFCGTTGSGGAGKKGTVFRIRENGDFEPVHSFVSGAGDGSGPVGLGASGEGNLYGTTYFGGANYLGTVFRIRWNGRFRTLFSFVSTNGGGYGPQGAPAEASDGHLYGTTLLGGANGCGTIYRLDGIPVPEPGGAQGAAALSLAIASSIRRLRTARR